MKTFLPFKDHPETPEGQHIYERRLHPRYPINMRMTYWVNVQGRTESYEAQTLNLSEGGIFVQLDTPLALGTEVLLQFRLPGSKEVLRAEGRVVWTREYPTANKELSGKGIKFQNLDEKTHKRLEQYILRQSHHSEEKATK